VKKISRDSSKFLLIIYALHFYGVFLILPTLTLWSILWQEVKMDLREYLQIYDIDKREFADMLEDKPPRFYRWVANGEIPPRYWGEIVTLTGGKVDFADLWRENYGAKLQREAERASRKAQNNNSRSQKDSAKGR
jgi:hypothetical protein